MSLELVQPPEGVELVSPQGPVLIKAPGQVDGEARTLDVVYRVTNGLASSQATITVRTAQPYNNPPVVLDAFGTSDDGDTVTVDVLESAYDPDGPADDLRVTKVFTPADVQSSVSGGQVTVARADQPRVYPFRVVDGDGGASTASLYVPPIDAGAPYLRPDALIEVDSGGSVTEDLDDLVVNPSGGPVRFTLRERVWASPATSVKAEITGNTALDVSASEQYEGPGAVVFEATTGTSVDDPAGVVAVLSVPVQVGDDTPILRCPDEPIEIAQDQSIDLEIASLCHVWTPQPDTLADLSFDADWRRSVDGLAIIEPSGPVITVGADGSADPGHRGHARGQRRGQRARRARPGGGRGAAAVPRPDPRRRPPGRRLAHDRPGALPPCRASTAPSPRSSRSPSSPTSTSRSSPRAGRGSRSPPATGSTGARSSGC